MGIKFGDLTVKKPIGFEELKNKKVGLDASNVLFQFLSSIRSVDGEPLMDKEGSVTSHLVGIFSRFTNLMEKGIKFAVCFDGIAPELKAQTQEERRIRKIEAEEKLKQAREDEDYELISKYSKQTARLNEGIIKESKLLFEYLGITTIQAPSEAEAQISYLNKINALDYTASSDMDCLVYGAPKLLVNLTLSTRRKLGGKIIKIQPEVIELEEFLNSMGINNEQLLIMAILIGTDFNDGIKGIGPKKALKIVKENKDYDKVFKNLNPDFDWEEVRDVFLKMPIEKNIKLKFDNKIQEDKIKELLVEEHDFNLERVEKTLDKLKKLNKGQKDLGKWL